MTKLTNLISWTFWLITIAFFGLYLCGNVLAQPAPSTDMGLRAAKGSLDDSVKLTWQKDPAAEVYNVLCDGTIIGQTMGNTTMFMHYRVAEGNHTYQVQAFNTASGTTAINASSISINKTATGVDDIGIGSVPRVGDIDFPDSKYASVGDLVMAIIKWLFGLVAALSVVALVYSGVTYTTAGMDTEKVFKAQKNIGWAITGIIVAASAFLIVSYLSRIIAWLNSV